MPQAQPEDFIVDIAHEQSYRYLQAIQYDHNSRTRRLIITNNNIPLPLTNKDLVTLHLWFNGKNYSNTTCLFREDGFPYVTFKEDMLKYAGIVSCQLKIWYSGNAEDSTITDSPKKSGVATTFEFGMDVSKSLLNQDRLVASSEFNVLNDLILQANAIPELIKQFKLSQEEVNVLIVKIQGDIANYTNQFDTMKTQYTNDFNVLIQQINSDITSYASQFDSLKSEVTTLKTTVTNWYTDAQAAENIRIANETERQTNTATAITNCETATANTNAAIAGANTARDNANTAATNAGEQASYAYTQAEAARIATESLHYELIDCDGGDARTPTEDYTNDFDGGGAGV